MKVKLIKSTVKTAKAKTKDYIIFDTELAGFGLKVTPTGRKIFIYQYRITGSKNTQRYTIGRYLDQIIYNGKPQRLTVNNARSIAEVLRGQTKSGINPNTEKNKTGKHSVTEALDEFVSVYIRKKLKPRTIKGYITNIENVIKPELKNKSLSDISRKDIIKIHSHYISTPFKANHVLAVLSKFFNWCEANDYREDNTNPCRHVEKHKTKGRERYLSDAENDRLTQVLKTAFLEETESEHAIAAINLLRTTGARRNEILTMRWEWVDLDNKVINLPDSKTGRKQIYLSTTAIQIFKSIPKYFNNPYVIVGKNQGEHLVNIQPQWNRLRTLAGLKDVRIHDLRHTFASVAVTNGMSLHMVGSLLGHKQPQTTYRYAHLADEKMKSATEEISKYLNF